MTKDISNRQLLGALTDQLGVITDNMVTKKDLDDRLQGFATKDDLKAVRDDLKGFATKDDLKAFATKDDLKAFATKDDLQFVRDDLRHSIDRLGQKIDGNHTVNVKHHLETRAAVGQLNQELTGLREGLSHAAGSV